MANFTRREFCIVTASLAIGSACRQIRDSFSPYEGRLTARPPANPVAINIKRGKTTLGLDQDRDALLYVPGSGKQRFPLFVMLHGATQNAEQMFEYLGDAADAAEIAVLAPNSRDITWDAITNSGGPSAANFGPDIDFINRALQRTFERLPVDATRISIGGFSDGASYGISLGLINGDMFPRVVAFSPGFIIDGLKNGKPRFFVSHGTHDHILPIDSCGRRIAANLQGRGYEVTFREFDGDHEIPAEVAREGLKWLAM